MKDIESLLLNQNLSNNAQDNAGNRVSVYRFERGQTPR